MLYHVNEWIAFFYGQLIAVTVVLTKHTGRKHAIQTHLFNVGKLVQGRICFGSCKLSLHHKQLR